MVQKVAVMIGTFIIRSGVRARNGRVSTRGRCCGTGLLTGISFGDRWPAGESLGGESERRMSDPGSVRRMSVPDHRLTSRRAPATAAHEHA
ncbi:hypothetical protein GCM10009592_19130 [Brachybacterium rhamnosum]